MSRPSFWNGTTCFVDGCTKPVASRGLCKAHRAKFHRHGSTTHRRPTFAEVRRQAAADAVITLIQAKLLPSSTSPQSVAKVLGLELSDLHAALERRRGARGDDLPRANRDRKSWPAGKKPCSQCGKLKALSNFHRDRNAVDGRSHMCRDCKVAYQRRWRRRRAA